MKKGNLIKVKYKGLNWDYFQNQVLSLGVKFHNLQRNDYKNITFEITHKDYNIITKNKKLKNYKLQIMEYSGFQKIRHNFVLRLGVYMGLLITLIGVVSVSRITLNYNIYGTNKLEKSVIVEKLEEFGIRIGRVNNFKNEDLEKYLLSELKDVSMVSVIKKGNSICVNIKEKDEQIDANYENLTSPYNIIIKSINVVSGTALYKEGDVVTAGKPIVGAYNIVEGKKIACEVIATITAEAWWTSSVAFQTQKTIFSRTGEKRTYNILLWNSNIVWGDEKSSPYEKYEIALNNGRVTGNFLPLNYASVTYYEVEEKVVKQKFEESRDILLHESRLMAYNKVPNNISIKGEEQKIISSEKVVYVNTYLTADVEIKNVGGQY